MDRRAFAQGHAFQQACWKDGSTWIVSLQCLAGPASLPGIPRPRRCGLHSVMPLDYSRPAAAPSPVSGLPRNLALLFLRLFTGGALLTWHGWSEGRLAWNHVWQKTAW